MGKIPANIVTGFLGVGKTTVIQHLLSQKPENERWAVLVNEFGEIGIDSNLYAEKDATRSGVTISQVPGGCMCCTNGLPMQIALNLLLAKAKPHRLLIEPTGLGHPKEILSVLTGKYYKESLDLQATVTLVDSRKLNDSRYTENSTFNEQIEIADVVIANKADLYEEKDFPSLLDYIDGLFGLDSKLVYQVQHGAVSLDWFSHRVSKETLGSIEPVTNGVSDSILPLDIEVPVTGYLSRENEGDGFFSRGWVFSKDWKFHKQELLSLMHSIDAERLKGVFKTSDGVFGFNMVDGVLSQNSLEPVAESRVELISANKHDLEGIEEALLACVIESDSESVSAGS